MIRTVLFGLAALVAVIWLIGLGVHILGAFIHIFIVAAIILLIGGFVLGRETV
jgi:hypothetical protein